MNSSQQDYYSYETPYQNFGLDAEMAHAQKPRRRFGCCCCGGCALGCLGFILLIVLGLAFIGFNLFGESVPLSISPETTVITEPLKSDGKTIDYHQAIQDMLKPEREPNDNGFRDLLIGFGAQVFNFRIYDDPEQEYRLMCEKLDIDPEVPPTFSLPLNKANDLERWVETVSPGLDAVQIALTKPNYYVPLIRQDENDLVVFSRPFGVFAFYDTLSRALRARAFYRFQTENESAISDAWKDILADLRLFRRAAYQTAWLTKITKKMEFDASRINDIQKIAVTFEQWTPEQLDQAIADLETLPRWQDRETTHKIIQFTMLDIIQTLGAEGGFTNLEHRGHPRVVDTDSALQTLNVISFDWNLVAKELNEAIKHCDELFAGAEGRNLDDQFAILELQKSKEQNNKDFIEKRSNEIVRAHFEANGIPDILSASGRSNLAGAIVGGPLFMIMAKEMYLLQLEEESRCQALRIALALERFHREKQQYPKSLDELDLKPLDKGMSFQYSSWDSGYTLRNNVFELRKE